MNIYIRSSGSFSPAEFPVPFTQWTNTLRCADPNLTGVVDPKLSRRMSHVIKMGMAAATEALQRAALQTPDAIVTGTAYGCLEDTGMFLKKQIVQQEAMLTPTAFIQSTHNTVGGQLGLLLKCNGYNNTFVHRGFSFEHALEDAMLLLAEGDAETVLVGAVDEITDTSHALLSRFDLYKNAPEDKNGTIAGEGAAFFVLDCDDAADNKAMLKGISTLYKPENNAVVEAHIIDFLAKHQLTVHDIDVIIAGKNGDRKTDEGYDGILESLFPDKPSIDFKTDCGEYPTAAAYALHMAVKISMDKEIPEIFNSFQPMRHLLIYNHFQNIHHAFQLVEAC